LFLDLERLPALALRLRLSIYRHSRGNMSLFFHGRSAALVEFIEDRIPHVGGGIRPKLVVQGAHEIIFEHVIIAKGMRSASAPVEVHKACSTYPGMPAELASCWRSPFRCLC